MTFFLTASGLMIESVRSTAIAENLHRKVKLVIVAKQRVTSCTAT
jgi:hypothetical protein